MTSEQVMELANKLNANKDTEDKIVDDKVSETKAKEEETKESTEKQETTDVSAKNEEKVDTNEQKKDEKETANPEESNDKVQVEKETKPTKPTKQEQIDYAFKREKAKRKRLEQRIKELEAENQKFKGLKLEDFKNNNSDYINYLVDMKLREQERTRLQEEYNSSKNEEFDAINQEREKNCYPDAESLEKYHKTIEKLGPSFVKELDEEDKEGVVLGFLDDCDVSPLMLQIMLTDSNYKNNILSKHSPYMKIRALEDLEKKIRYAQAEMSKRNSTVPEKNEETKPVETKPTMPVIGSVTKSESNPNGKVVEDYNQILHKLNQNRYGSY